MNFRETHTSKNGVIYLFMWLRREKLRKEICFSFARNGDLMWPQLNLKTEGRAVLRSPIAEHYLRVEDNISCLRDRNIYKVK